MGVAKRTSACSLISVDLEVEADWGLSKSTPEYESEMFVSRLGISD